MNSITSFLYTVDPEAEEPIMLIDRHIGFDSEQGFGIMGDLFQRELLALDGMEKKRIQIWINSPGGIVSDGYNIYNAILKTKTKVDTYNTGIAASIAAVIFQAGRTRYMADYSKLMYHDAFGGDDDKGLSAINDSIVTMIASRCGVAEDEVRAIMKKTTWIGADEAKEKGFCDEVQNSGEMNRKRSIKTPEEAKAFWSESNAVLNKIFNKSNSSVMKKVANKLNLNPEATEDSIVAEIEKVENRAKIAEEALNKKGSDIQKKEEELDKLKDELKKCQDELADMKAKNKAKEEEEAKNKAKAEEEAKAAAATAAKNAIDAFVVQGRIKNDEEVKNVWIEKYIADPAGVKNMIESLPVNQKATSLKVVGTAGENKIGSVVANKMANLKAAGK